MAQAQPYYKDDAGSSDDAPGKMFIGGLSWETTQDGLRNYFVKYGEIADCVVMRDPATGRSRGFGFITFADPKCCDDVMQSGPHQLDQRTIDPKMAVPRAPEAKQGRGVTRTKKVFIGGLPFETTEDQFKEYFSKYGKVEEVVLMRDRVTNKPRGFGFVTFDSEDTVDRLCEVQYVEIGDKKVEIKKAEPKIMSDMRQRPYARGGRGGYPSSFMSPYPPPFSGYPSYRGGRGGAFPPRDYGYPPPPASYYPPPSRGAYGSRPAPYPEDAGRSYGYDGYGRDYDAYGPPPADYAPAHGSTGAYPYPRPTSAGSSSYPPHSSYAPDAAYAPPSAPAPYGDSYGAGVPMGGHYEQTGSYGPTRGAAGYRTSPY